MKKYRIVKLAGFQFWRIQVWSGFFFPRWKFYRRSMLSYEGVYKAIAEFPTFQIAQDFVTRLREDDEERLVRSLGLWHEDEA